MGLFSYVGRIFNAVQGVIHGSITVVEDTRSDPLDDKSDQSTALRGLVSTSATSGTSIVHIIAKEDKTVPIHDPKILQKMPPTTIVELSNLNEKIMRQMMETSSQQMTTVTGISDLNENIVDIESQMMMEPRPIPSTIVMGTSNLNQEIASKTMEPNSISSTIITGTTNLDQYIASQPRELNPKTRLFGLIIGINSYNRSSQVVSTTNHHDGAQVEASSNVDSSDPPTFFADLAGAVADAERFYEYLILHQKVPEQQITLLCDEKATRTGIISAFQNLGNEDNGIRKGDSIVIFYAGHGAQASPPKRLLRTAGCPQFVEVLLPYDFNDVPGRQPYMGIPDYTLASLLTTIAENKGDNITVIFDCCHSASALRGARPMPTFGPDGENAGSPPITRGGPELNYNLPDDLDKAIWARKRSLTVLPRLRHLGAASYVFFAACASSELAQEDNGRGRFTSALLALLQEVGSDILPCSQIISRLGIINGQNPQCEGLHRDRTIFHGFSSPRKKNFFYVRTDSPKNLSDSTKPSRSKGPSSKESPRFLIEVGSVNGLSKGDVFTVYKTESDDDQRIPIGDLVIDTLFTRKSYLRVRDGSPLFNLPSNPAPALLTKSKQPHLLLHINVPNGATRDALVSRVDHPDLRGTVSITDPKTAHISLSMENDANIRFDVVDVDLVVDGRKLDCGHHLVDATIPQDNFAGILKGLAHYYWHLKRNSKPTPSPVTISFYELEQHFEPPYFRVRSTDKANPVPHDLYNSETRCIDLEVGLRDDDPTDDDGYEDGNASLYGLKVTNNTEYDLYPALFYFDNTDFTIVGGYHPPLSNQKAEPPLKPKDSMTIGYGGGPGASVRPFTFSLAPDQNMEIGFFKLILSTRPIGLQGMEQKVPVFSQTRGIRQANSAPDTWYSSNIMVVQRLCGHV